MDSSDNLPILNQLLGQCDNFLPAMKSAKQKQGKTNQDIADATGIPISNIAKFFSGNLANPGVYNAAAVCKYLEVSLDEHFGIRNNIVSLKEKESEISSLKAENEALKQQLELSKQLIQAHEKSITSARNAYEGQKMILFCAVILIVSLMIIGSFYITLDFQDSNNGFYQNGGLTPLGVVILGTALIGLNVFVAMIRRIIKGKVK